MMTIKNIYIILFIYLGQFLIEAHEQNSTELPFMVPHVPLIPSLSIVCNIVLMTNLNLLTWIRFFIWMVIGKLKILNLYLYILFYIFIIILSNIFFVYL